MNKSHNRRPFGKPKVNRWIKRFTWKRYRKRIKQALLKTDHLPKFKDVNNPWDWD